MSYALGLFAAKKEEERERKALRDHFAGLEMNSIAVATMNASKGDAELVARNS